MAVTDKEKAGAFFDALGIAPQVQSEMVLGHKSNWSSLVATLRKIAKKRGIKLPSFRGKGNSSSDEEGEEEQETERDRTECPLCKVGCFIDGADLIEQESGEVHYVGDERCQRLATPPSPSPSRSEAPKNQGTPVEQRFREAVARVRERLGIVRLAIGFRNDEVKDKVKGYLSSFGGDLDIQVERLITESLKRKQAKKKIGISLGDLEATKKALPTPEVQEFKEQVLKAPKQEMKVASETLGPPIVESFLGGADQKGLFDEPSEKVPSTSTSAQEASSPASSTSETIPSPSDVVGAYGTEVAKTIDREVMSEVEQEKTKKKEKVKDAKAQAQEEGQVEIEGRIIRVARNARELVESVFDSDFFEVVKLAVSFGLVNHPALPDVITDKDLSAAWVEYAKTKMKAKAESTIDEEKKHVPDGDSKREYFSASSINQFIRCPYQWYRRRVLKEIEPPSIALAFGSSFDDAANKNYSEKMKTMKDEPDSVLHDVFVQSLEGRKDSIWYDENPKRVIEDAKQTGTKLISVFKKDIMTETFPQEVQEKITTPLASVDYDLFSILDLTTVDGRVVDNKTSARAWHEGKERQELQRTMYSLAYLAKYGRLPSGMEYHIGIKTKEPKTQVIKTNVTEDEIQGFLKFVAFVVAQIRASVKSGIFVPRRDHNLCSTRHCGYFSSCEKEWGWKIYEPKKKGE